MTNVAVLVSGAGSILESILAEDIPVALALADRPCRGLEIAEQAGVATALVDRKQFGFAGSASAWDRRGFTEKVIQTLHLHDIELVAMAGFMTIFDPVMFDTYGGKILNTHPSLLPAFKGENAVQDALDAGATITGCTIHYATADLDGGPIIAQREVQIQPNDTKESLHERIKQVERELYPEILANLLAGRAT